MLENSTNLDEHIDFTACCLNNTKLMPLYSNMYTCATHSNRQDPRLPTTLNDTLPALKVNSYMNTQMQFPMQDKLLRMLKKMLSYTKH